MCTSVHWRHCHEVLKRQLRVNADLHFIQLLVDLLIILIVFAQLCDQSSVGQREQLRIL